MKKEHVLYFLLIFCCLNQTYSQSGSRKFDYWTKPSHFKGFNVLINDMSPQFLADFIELKSSGCNIVQIGFYGLREPVAPYNYEVQSVKLLDSLIGLCRQVDMKYTIAVRSGPGRSDVAVEGDGFHPKSTLWTNKEEQALYASSVREIAERYNNDSLFIGLGLILEPNPFFDQLYLSPTQLKGMMDQAGIDVNKLQKQIIDSVRKSASLLPLLVQNVAFSSAEFFPLIQKQDDPYIVYEFHCYRPVGYAHNENPYSQTYPGNFLSVNDISIKKFDKDFFRDNVFKYVREFQQKHHVPIFLGEFGLMLPQNGGKQLLDDITDIAVDMGWHFAYWVWNGKGVPFESFYAWNYPVMGEDYYDVVKDSFKKTYSSVLSSSIENAFSIYPNPVKDVIYIESNYVDITEVEIVNVIGYVELSSKDLKSSGGNLSINLTNLPQGVYYIIAKTGKAVLSQKFVKIN